MKRKYSYVALIFPRLEVETANTVIYRPSADTVLTRSYELVDSELEDGVVSHTGFHLTKAGGCGLGRQTFSLHNIRSTVDMEGRSLGSSCTHNNPTCMHFITSDRLHESLSVSSIISCCLSSFHNRQA